MKKRIGIIFGGNSVEHEISIITALQAMENIDNEIYEVVPIYLSKEHKFYSSPDFFNINIFKDLINIEKKYNERIIVKSSSDEIKIVNKKRSLIKGADPYEIDVFFPIVHGTNVEDGKLYGFLDTLNLPHLGSTTAGVLGQHKSVAKDILEANKINQVKYIWINEKDQESISRRISEAGLKYPFIIKPESLGSSIGLVIANSPEDLGRKVDEAFKYDSNIVLEEMLEDFDEYNISVAFFDDDIHLSAVEQVQASKKILTYEDKYLTQGSKKTGSSSGMASLDRILPAKISRELEEQIQIMAVEVYKILKCESVVRIDLMVKDDVLYFNEVNNIPGSLAFYLWEEVGLPYKELLMKLIEEGIRAYYKKSSKKFSFTTNVLNLTGGKLHK